MFTTAQSALLKKFEAFCAVVKLVCNISQQRLNQNPQHTLNPCMKTKLILVLTFLCLIFNLSAIFAADTKSESNKGSFLKLISGNQGLTIAPTDGTKVVADATRLFNDYLDGNFREWKIDVQSGSTTAQSVNVHQMIKEGGHQEIYASLNSDLNALVLTQSQIIQFVRDNQDWLCEDGDTDYLTFFLFKAHDEFFVACVSKGDDGLLSASVSRLAEGVALRGGFRNRFVIPAK